MLSQCNRSTTRASLRLARAAVFLAIALVGATRVAASASALPDGRQWELVSPPNTSGASISAFTTEGGVAQAAADGDAFTWSASAPVGAEAAGSRSLEWAQIFSTRSSTGWSSQDIAPPNEAATGFVVGDQSEYKLFSSDLSLGLVEPKGETPLSPEATERTIYLHEDAGGGYLPLVTRANVSEGAKIDTGTGIHQIGPEFLGATPDFGDIVFSSPQALTADADAYTGEHLYEWTAGALRLVNVPPENESAGRAAGGDLGYEFDHRQAISDDGSRVVWSTGRGNPDGDRLYMRDMTRAETVRLDVAQGAREPAGADAQFQTANSEGSRVFFTDDERLTADSDAAEASPDLYVFESTNAEDESLKGTLTDLTVAVDPGESAGVQGLLPGASEDGSYVYLVATGVLTEAENVEHEKATPGAENLYVSHETGTGWTTAFIARLADEDRNDWGAATASGGGLYTLTSRVSPNGRYLAFMSDRSLTGYDNEDASSKAPGERLDEEVFLYDADTGSLACASCDPTGARPIGALQKGLTTSDPLGRLLVDEDELWLGRWLAGNVPGWTPVNLDVHAFRQPSYLSNSGRLFFNSSDALVPQDVNGTEDVYEYEPAGVPAGEHACASSSEGGNDVFKPARAVEVQGGMGEEPAGCVALISGGNSAEESVFLDASESGGDAFFLTDAKLVPQDRETNFAVYDAHECTPRSPCAAPALEAPPECTTADACRAPSVPRSPIVGPFSSETVTAAGAVVAPQPKAKPLTRAQKLARALATCRKKPRQKRATCDRRAHEQYGASRARQKKKTSRTKP